MVMKVRKQTCLAALLSVLVFTQAGAGQVLEIDEAERGKIVCKSQEIGRSIWASNGALTPPFWGFAPGESVEWKIRVPATSRDLKLAVRYSYAAEAYRNFHHTENPKRQLHLIVDGDDKKPIPVHVPDTGWWDIFNTTSVNLPERKAGDHTM